VLVEASKTRPKCQGLGLHRRRKICSRWLRRRVPATVRARPGLLSALSVFHSKSVLYGAFVYGRALNSQKWRFPARVGQDKAERLGTGRSASAISQFYKTNGVRLLGFGRIVASHYRSSTVYQIH
jgi:hypothetical protein